MTIYNLGTAMQGMLALIAFVVVLRSKTAGLAIFFFALGINEMWWTLARLTFAEVEPIYRWVSSASGMDGKLFFERAGFVAWVKAAMVFGLLLHIHNGRAQTHGHHPSRRPPS